MPPTARDVLRTYHDAFSGLPQASWLLSGVLFVNRMGFMVMPFLPMYLTDRRSMTIEEVGELLSIYGCGAIAGAYLGGILCNRVGLLRVQAWSLAGTAGAFLVLLHMHSWWGHAVLLSLLGLVSEGFGPANSAATAALVPAGQRSRAMALSRLGSNLGIAMGPAAGGFLAAHDHALLFYVDAASSLAALGVLMAAARRLGASIPGMYAVQASAGVSEADTVRSGGGVLWSDWKFLTVIAVSFSSLLVFFQIDSTVPLYVQNEVKVSPAGIGLIFTINTVLIVVFEMIVVRKAERFRPLVVVAYGVLLVGIGFGIMAWAKTYALVVVAVAVWTFGEMLTLPVLDGWIADRAPNGQRPAYFGLHRASAALACALAPILGTRLYELDAQLVWYVALVLGVVSCVIFLTLAERTSQDTPGSTVERLNPSGSMSVSGSRDAS
jgi:MFS family permease